MKINEVSEIEYGKKGPGKWKYFQFQKYFRQADSDNTHLKTPDIIFIKETIKSQWYGMGPDEWNQSEESETKFCSMHSVLLL